MKAARAATTAIPIVALDLESDPVNSGFVASLSRPGGNITGLLFDFPDFSAKWLELLMQMVPGLARVTTLWDPATDPVQLNGVNAAAALLGIELQVLNVETLAQMEFRLPRCRPSSNTSGDVAVIAFLRSELEASGKPRRAIPTSGGDHIIPRVR